MQHSAFVAIYVLPFEFHFLGLQTTLDFHTAGAVAAAGVAAARRILIT